MSNDTEVHAHARATTTVAQRTAGWSRLVQPGPINCVSCGAASDHHVSMTCRECFIGDGIRTGPIGMTAEIGGEPALPPPPPGHPAPACGFCRRTPDLLKKDVETMIAGATAMICSTCASACAGCIGAKTAAEARAMMALSSVQAEAVAQCVAMMKRSGHAAADAFGRDGHSHLPKLPPVSDERADLALTFAQSAELLARIARGGA